MESFDIAVIGAGAAGMMCAAVAGQRGGRVALIDHAPRLAEKIRISGGGRCNFTNLQAGPANYLSSNPHFCRSALARYTPQDFLGLLRRYDIGWHEKHRGQLFCDDSAENIIAMLRDECASGRVAWRTGTRVMKVRHEGGAYVLEGAKRHGSPDNAVVTVRHTSNAVSTMYVSWTAGHGNFTLDVYGSDGRVGVDLVRSQAMTSFRPRRSGDGAAAGWDYPDLVWEYGYAGEQQYFVDRILGRVDGARTGSPAAARDALALVLAAQRSLDERSEGVL